MNLARGTLFNLVGLAAPLPLALLAIPLLISAVGDARFGMLTLVWAVTTYLGLFDIGLGRALTLQLSVALERGEHDRIGPLSATALSVMAALGLVGSLAFWLAAPALAGLIKDLPDRHEAIRCMQLMSLALPFVVLTAGLRGMLEAVQAFDLVNFIRVPLGLWTLAGPVLQVTLRPPDLAEITMLLVAGRAVGCIAHALLLGRRLPMLRGRMRVQWALLPGLVRSGGWLTVSNLVSPLMGYADRFILGALLSAAAVAYYATPQEVTSKLWILPGALTAALFPALAGRIATADAQTPALCREALQWLVIVMLPLTLALALFAEVLLGAWLGDAFAAHSAFALQAFSAGMFAGGLAQLPFTILQSAGRARSTAIVHVIELPAFLLLLVWATGRFGVNGAAFVWFARCAIDGLVLFVIATRTVRIGGVPLFSAAEARVTVLASAAYAGLLLPGMAQRVAWLVAVCAVAVAVAVARLRQRK